MLSVWQSHITDRLGNVLENADVEVFQAGTNTLVQIFSDANGENPLSQPFQTDQNGLARFYAKPQLVDIKATKNNQNAEFKNVPLFERRLADIDASNGGSQAHIKWDGSKFFLTSFLDGQPVLEPFIASTTGSSSWDITDAGSISATSASFFSLEHGAVAWKPDGTRMFISGRESSAWLIRQYDVSTPWDPTTATFNGVEISANDVPEVDGVNWTIQLTPTGDRIFFDSVDTGTITQIDLPVPFDLSSVGTVQSSSSLGNNPFYIANDGKKLYEEDLNSVNQYTLGNEWDVTNSSSDATFSESDIESLVQASNISQVSGVSISPDGLKFFIVYEDNGTGEYWIAQFSLGARFDLSSSKSLDGETNITANGPVTGGNDVTGGFAIFDEGTRIHLFAEDSTYYQWQIAGTLDYTSTETVSLEDKDCLLWNFEQENTHGKPSLEDGSGNVRDVRSYDGSPLWAGALKGNHWLRYHAANDEWRVLNPRGVFSRGNLPTFLDIDGSIQADQVPDDFVKTDKLDLSISPTWTSKHTFSVGIDAGSSAITSVADGSNDTDAVNKRQLDDVNQGRTRKQAAKAAATGDVDLSSSTDPNPIDGYTLSDGDRVLLPNQGTGTENGIYDAVTATDPTTWVRSSDADEDEEVKAGISLVILNGTQNADKEAVQDTENPTLGTDTLTFSLYSLSSVSAGTGLSKTGNTLDLTINGLSSLGAAPDAADKLAVYDDSAGSHVEISMSELESFITDGVSVTGTQWGYLGGLDQPLSSSDSPDFGGFTISSTQWGYVGGLGSAPAETGASNTFTALQTVNNAEGIGNGYKIQGTSAGAIDFRWLQKSTTTFEFTDETNAVEIAQYDQSTGNWDFRSANPMNNGNDLLDTTDLSANGGNVVTDDRTNTFVGVQRIERSNFPGIEHRDTAGNTGDANDMFFSGMDDKGNYVIRSMDASSGAHESIVKVDFAAPNDSLVIDQNGNFGIGTSSPSSKLDIGLATEDAAVVDAGSSGATQQDWIEVTVGGNTGYLRVYASK